MARACGPLGPFWAPMRLPAPNRFAETIRFGAADISPRGPAPIGRREGSFYRGENDGKNESKFLESRYPI